MYVRQIVSSNKKFVNEARTRAQNWTPSANEPYAHAYFADQVCLYAVQLTLV